MARIKIKALSVNKCWQGRRFKTKDYKNYERELWYLLPNRNIPRGKLKLTINVGVSSKNADLDNIAKPLIDILQQKYLFNDKSIYKLFMSKEDVEKGQEYIEVEFSQAPFLE